MRRILLLAVCSLLTSVLLAGPVTKEQAQQVASQFLAGKSVTHRAPALDQLRTEVVLNAVDESGQPYLYAISQDKANGFVIVSGDDRFRSILGYSQTGSFDSANMPDNMRAWLQGYIEEMKYYIAKGYQPQTGAAHRAAGVKKAISPLIQTLWDQGEPYNQKCPDFFTYGKSVTGCVATAMAQVIYYTSYIKGGGNPSSTLAPIAAYSCDRNWGGLGKVSVSAVPAGTKLDWGKMLLDYSGSSTADEENAVATLMQVCGASVHMDYANSDNGGSGASTSAVANAMITYFGYDNTTRLVVRDNYSYANWAELVYNEINNARPVLYGGQSSGGGHAFVIDGYDGDELFHVNWGWGGHQNNYFALSVMNPGDKSGIGAGSSNDGYSYGQDAVIGIQIGSGVVVEPKPVTMSTTNFTISGNNVVLSAYNWTGETQTFDVGIGSVEGDGTINVIQVLQSNQELVANYGYSDMQYAFEKDAVKANQKLKVIPISKLTSAAKWATDINYDKRYIEVAYDAEGNPTLTSYPLAPALTSTISFTGSKYKDETQPVVVTVNNTGGEFYGVLYFFASTNSSNKGSSLNKGGITVLKDKSNTMTFQWTPETTGTYYIWVTTDEAGTNVIGNTTVAITVNPHAPAGPFIISQLEVSEADETSWTVDGDGNILVDVYSKEIAIAPTIKNISSSNYSGFKATFLLQRWTGSAWSDVPTSFSSGTFTFKAGTTANFGEMSYGTDFSYGKYRIILKVGGTEYDSRYTLNLTMGYNTIDANGNLVRVKTDNANVTVADNATAIDLSDFNYTGITPNSNPNTLYIISDTQTAPASLDGKNVVKGGQIAKLSLSDGYAFASPIDFHADEITYTRTFDKYYDNGKNWTTIVLPFAATKVENTDGTLPWDEANRKFWLMEFNGETGSDVIFTTAPATLEANTPYIIALPGSDQGSLSLVGKNTLTFSADNADIKANAKSVVTVSSYKFVGTMTNTGSLENIYALNSEGDKFKKGTATVSPFRAYFVSTSAAATSTSLGINIGGSATGIESLQLSEPETQREGIYNLNGQRVSQPKKGLYIINGKKVIIK